MIALDKEISFDAPNDRAASGRRLIVASNRVPPLGDRQLAGGLAVALKAALEERTGLWFGWSGKISEDASGSVRTNRSGSIDFATLDLTEQEFEGYYAGFANRTLWPLLHGRLDLVHFDLDEFACYRSVNRRFAEHFSKVIDGDDLVWVHDFHLAFLGTALRRLGVRARLGFFLHIPFPSPDVLVALPCHLELMHALAEYDLIGLQTDSDVRNFRDFIVRHAGGSVDENGTVRAFGRTFRVGAFPIGIDVDTFSRLASETLSSPWAKRLKDTFAGQDCIMGACRLDYTKGIPNRLQAFGQLLETAPDLHGRAFLLQIAAPSRQSVPEYVEIREELEALSGHINARYGRVDWTPVRYLNQTFSQPHLAALFRLSRVGLITPLADGMNLVAKEYVAAQDGDDPGVLVLSQFAGAAERLTAALIVNPYDIEGMAVALRRALEMPLDERRSRWAEMMAELRRHDVFDWSSSFLHALDGAVRQADAPEGPIRFDRVPGRQSASDRDTRPRATHAPAQDEIKTTRSVD